MKSIHAIPTIQIDISTDTQQTYSVVFSEITKLQCVKCLKPEDEIPNCDLCNWHTETATNDNKTNANTN